MEQNSMNIDGNIFPKGFMAGGIESGVKGNGKKDLALIFSDRPAVAAGLFTRNRIKAAPVLLDIERIKGGRCAAVIINSGNANACTGDRGLEDANSMAIVTATSLGIAEDLVMVASTGVIGEPLPIRRINESIPLLASAISDDGWHLAAEAIMTTDSFPKMVVEEDSIDGVSVRITGIAKGAGMIEPDMATMLAFIATDACVEGQALQLMLRESTHVSFNRITVDGDTSTNDMVLMLANGAAGNRVVDAGSRGFGRFREMLEKVCLQLSKMIVRDGEGATKFIEISVCGAETEEDALSVAKRVANSLLVKTAFFGEDLNWGRIISAIGVSGIAVVPEKVSIYVGGIPVAKDGEATGREDDASGHIRQNEISLKIDIGMGNRSAVVYTTDLSYDYVRINASYRS